MVAPKYKKVSIEKYLKIEAQSEFKYEYHDGEIYAMSGGTIEHAIICTNTQTSIKNELRLKNSTCRTIGSEARIFIQSLNAFLYPDTSVICQKIERDESGHGICNPTLIVEVLSKSTADYDRGDKFFKYRQLTSLREYVLIDQEKYMVEVFYKPAKTDLWRITRFEGANSIVHFESINLKINMSDIYEDVSLKEE